MEDGQDSRRCGLDRRPCEAIVVHSVNESRQVWPRSAPVQRLNCFVVWGSRALVGVGETVCCQIVDACSMLGRVV